MIEILVIILILLSAVILHEYAHGLVAYKLGDPTAKDAGRLTLNPIKHIDLVGTIIVPGTLLILRTLGGPSILFGWAKPVPVNFMKLKNPKRDMMLVGAAGPITNILLAIIFALLAKTNSPWINPNYVGLGIFINLLLATFNMMPIPPLDGSRVLMGILPNPLAIAYGRLEPYGMLIVVILLYLHVFDLVLIPIVDFLANLLGVQLK